MACSPFVASCIPTATKSLSRIGRSSAVHVGGVHGLQWLQILLGKTGGIVTHVLRRIDAAGMATVVCSIPRAAAELGRLVCGAQELNRIFVRSYKLNSEAIVEFVSALCTVAREELRVHGAPRVYSLNKIVEIAHFNMERIRYALSSTRRLLG